MKKNTFTLIELLTVIAIIAVLAGMLMPALNKARSKAAAINCVANQKQVMTTAILYSNDNKQRLPYSTGDSGIDNWWDSSQAGYNSSWCGKIYQLVLEPKIFLCNNANEDSSNFTNDKYGVSYTAVKEISLMKLTRMQNPAGAIYIYDNDKTNNLSRIMAASKGSSAADTISDDWKNDMKGAKGVHDDKINAGFVDGHAATYRVTDSANELTAQNALGSNGKLTSDYQHK